MTAKNQKQNSGRNPVVKGFVKGVPVTKPAGSANKGVKKWQENVKEQTAKYKGKVKGPCRLRVVFYLPESKYSPYNANFGPDLDNLAKPFLDALKETLFSAISCDGDACVISLQLSKVKVFSEEEAGASFQVSLTQGHKIEKVEEVTGADLGFEHWTEPMQKITTDTGVYLDNLPGSGYNVNFPPGYDWKSEEGEMVFGVEVRESCGWRWLKRTP